LIKTNLLTNVTTEVMDGVVNLQARYGTDGSDGTPADGLIADTEWQTAAPTDWSKLLAVRVALLTRSQQFEKDYVASAVPSWWAPFKGRFWPCSAGALRGYRWLRETAIKPWLKTTGSI
jgi:type IV pilus assembly protein PilW